MLFSVDPDSPDTLADQIAGQVRGALAAGRLEPGDRLPPAREVAAGLTVNMHTVLRAYAVLRDEGLIELRRGRGAQVRATVDAEAVDLDQRIRELVAAAGRLGIGTAQLVRQVEQAAS